MKTIKDIAIEAKVSTGTVDRVIHNRPGVSEKTRKRIEFLLEKYNFEINRLASTLAYKRRYTLATLIPSPESEENFWHDPNQGMQKAIREIRRYMVTTHCFYFIKNDLESYKHAQKEILELNPDGVLFAPFFYKSSVDFVYELNQRTIPYVFINIDIGSHENLSFIGQDSFQSGRMSAKLLDLMLDESDQLAIVRSRKNIGNHHSIDARSDGFLSFFTEENSTKKIHQLVVEDLNLDEVEKILSLEIEHNPNLKGIFVPSTAAFLVAQFLESKNLQSMRVVGFDTHQNNLKYLQQGTLDFLIDQDPFEQGYLGIKVIFDYLLFRKIPKTIYNTPINIVSKENSAFFRRPAEAETIV